MLLVYTVNYMEFRDAKNRKFAQKNKLKFRTRVLSKHTGASVVSRRIRFDCVSVHAEKHM